MSDSLKDLERLNLENEALRQRLASLEHETRTLRAESDASWRILVDEAPVCIATVALDQRFLTCNAAFCAFLGYSPDELKQKTIAEVTLPEDRHLGMAELGEIMAGKRQSATVEKRYVRKDGTVVWGEVFIKLVRDSQGKPVHFLPIILDVTDRRQAEEVRTRLEEQLRASQKMEAIGILAGGVAHDFNNLLCVILSYTGFVLDSLPDDDPRKADLLEVEKASERAVALTRQLLAFSRRQVMQPVTLDLNQVATGMEKMLRRILGEDISFAQVLAPDLGLTLADPGQIEQVLMNLAVNARDAMPVGGELTVETSNVEIGQAPAENLNGVSTGSFVMFSVTDTGCGMDAQTREHIFEPFYTTKEKGRGTGLGLSTVYGIIKQSGGEILVESEPGQGSTFRILLPLITEDWASLPVRPTPAPKRVSGGTETLLVVEDEEGLRNVALRVLTEAGYKVLAAAGGKEALRLCELHGGEIGLILTDVIMPEMSGKELADQLALTRPGLKVLFMSGYTHDTIVHHGVLDPAVHFLGKPFTSAALRQKVREVLDN